MEKQIQTQGFDLIVHKRDKKTGRVTSASPYRLHVKDGVEYFERPKGSCNLFFRNGDPAGRLGEKGEVRKGEKHIEWIPPMTSDQLLAQQHAAQAAEIKKLQAELDAYKREKKYAKGADAVKNALGNTEKSDKEA